MTPELQKALAEMIATVNTTAQRELPLVVQEYLRWGVWSAGLGVTAGLLVGILAAVLFRVAQSERLDDEDMTMMVSIASVICMVGTLFLLIPNIYHLIQIHVAPRVYLLEQLKAVVQ